MKNYPPVVLDALADRGITINDGSSGKPSGIIVSGARCTWWDGIEKAGSLKGASGHGLPCCPYCGGVLFQHDDEAAYLAGAPEYEADGHPGYVAMLRWARGKCFSDLSAMESTYAAERGEPTDATIK